MHITEEKYLEIDFLLPLPSIAPPALRISTTHLHLFHPSLRRPMKFFSSSFAVLSLGLFSAASPVAPSAEMAVRDTDPNTSVVPLTLFALFQTLEEAVRTYADS
ncbi:hypothetical protein B0H14DRAFT_3144759, partial [Mycena olivaceomarginata]